MIINISYLTVPIEYGFDFKLKDHMTLTGAISEKATKYYPIQPLYQNVFMEFDCLHKIVKSDFRQYSNFNWIGGYKNSERWTNINQDLLILDVDDGLTILEAKNIFKDFKYLICTTKSHQVEKKGLKCDRFRIILPAINIPKDDLYFDFIKELESKYSFIDKQVNTKTGSFLGFAKCEYWYNKGQIFNCGPYVELAITRKKIREQQELEKPAPKNNYENEDLGINKIKQLLTQETVRDILNANGFDVDRNFKLKLREERTPSTSISRDCLIKDFGSDFAGDIFEVLMTFRNMNFIQSVDEVKKYV